MIADCWCVQKPNRRKRSWWHTSPLYYPCSKCFSSLNAIDQVLMQDEQMVLLEYFSPFYKASIGTSHPLSFINSTVDSWWSFLSCIPAFTSLQDENFLQGFLYQAEPGFLQQEWIWQLYIKVCNLAECLQWVAATSGSGQYEQTPLPNSFLATASS